VLAAARAVTRLRLGRLDEETTANVGTISGGAGGTNIVPDRAHVLAEVRSLDPRKAEATVAEMVDSIQDAANEPSCDVDVDVDVELLFHGFRHADDAPQVLAAEEALRACGHTPRRIVTGGGSDANAFEARGFPCTNLANGTERNHEPTERVSVAALEGMLDVTFALLEECAP
jgi:tripeptide aminopeptidase